MPKSSDGLRHMIMRARPVSGSESLRNCGIHSPLEKLSVILEWSATRTDRPSSRPLRFRPTWYTQNPYRKRHLQRMSDGHRRAL